MPRSILKRKNSRIKIRRNGKEGSDSYEIFSQVSKEPKPPVWNIADEVRLIKERNVRVERDKAWETSFARRIVITLLTYLVATLWLIFTDDPSPWLKALFPALGYFISTLSLSFAKYYWLEMDREHSASERKNSNPPPLI